MAVIRGGYFILLSLVISISAVFSIPIDDGSSSSTNGTDHLVERRCFCHIEDIDAGNIIYNYGEIMTFQRSDTDDCHDVHKECREACSRKLHLKGFDGKRRSDRRGYKYCDSYGQVTKRGDPVTLKAVWDVDNCKSDHEVESLKTVDLCCGHTYINMHPGGYMKRFGWNPDCRSQRFVFSRTRKPRY